MPARPSLERRITVHASKYFLPHLVKSPLVRLKYRLIDKRGPLQAHPEHDHIQTFSGCNGN